jgi:hypothetical protein
MDLFNAVRSGEAEKVQSVLERHPESAMSRDADGATALHYAAENGHQEIVVLLLDAGADINALDARFGATPAGWAIEYLRQRGALLGIEIRDTVDAIAHGNVELVRRYVSRFPALIDATDAHGTPLRVHALRSGLGEIAQLFVREG